MYRRAPRANASKSEIFLLIMIEKSTFIAFSIETDFLTLGFHEATDSFSDGGEILSCVSDTFSALIFSENHIQ